MQNNTEYSLLRKAKVRTLPIALAHCLVLTKTGDPLMASLNRIFTALPSGLKLACLHEMAECRAAKRGERLAQVTRNH